ncbi:MAG: tRNA (guanosine(37)-N1)-methyltransferase TrmD, partial [Betaproteobacteria bacterium]|nr:tRNA (guanosine(37)-N1)-methyltransferase TrmD [Betaproteobacteria bacterium]
LMACLAHLEASLGQRQHRILLTPAAKPARQEDIMRLAGQASICLIAGRYEGIDQRFIDREVDECVSLGDLVVSGGELPAMMLIDAIVRWLPGVLHDEQSAQQDSFVDGLLDCPHYTRPESWEGIEVPSVLLGGHHDAISRWRRNAALTNTARVRPDLINQARSNNLLSAEDERLMARLQAGRSASDPRPND